MDQLVEHTVIEKEINNDELDRRIILQTQSGLPIVAQPYKHIASELGISTSTLMRRLEIMKLDGRIRRIGAVPNHYKLGYTANGMSVWDIDDENIEAIGKKIGNLDMVTHCYQRPRYLPEWPYNLFAMLHGHDRNEVLEKVEHIAELLGSKVNQHDILFSTRILKKTGLRLKTEG